MENSERLTMSVVEAARTLGISRYAAYAAVKNGQIPVLKIGKRLLVPKVKLMRMIEGNDEKPEGAKHEG